MAWDDEPLYERHPKKKSNVVDITEKRQQLKWAHEVMIEKNREPRAAQESPLKRWWLEQEALKEAENANKSD